MPCNSSYMEANGLEVEVSRMILLAEELKTGKHVNPKSDGWRGYHPDAYGSFPTRQRADELAAYLCGELRKRTAKQIAAMSLEMQMWWRDHKKADGEAGR